MAVARCFAKSSRRESRDFNSDFFNKYATTTHYLTRGASGNVYGPIQWKKTQLAIKQTYFKDGDVTEQFKKVLEIKKYIWTSLEHRHLMRIHSVYLGQFPKVMSFVMEFAAGGSLHKTLSSLESDNKLPVVVVTDWARQIAEGMLYLHEKHIIHRDLKSSNILLMKKFSDHNPCSMLTLKIADFDEVKEYDHTTTMSFVGTCAYMAPESLQNQWYSKASDVWSYGVVVWEMISGDIPHKGLHAQEIMSKAINGRLPKLHVSQSFPEDFKLLLKQCCELDYKRRPSFESILRILDPTCMKKNKSDQVLIEMIGKRSTKGGAMTFTILKKELFVVIGKNSEVEVYDSIEFSFSRRWKLEELIDPWDIVSCKRNKCLYIIDFKAISELNEILKVDPNGKLIVRWSKRDDRGRCLSVTDKSNIILTCFERNTVNEYSPDGQLIREINLSSDAGICCPYHAIKLTNGNFMVSQSDYDNDLHRVCIVDADGKLMKSFGGKGGSNNEAMNHPVYLSIDRNGFVMVADQLNHRVLLLDSNLNFKKEILTKDVHKLKSVTKIHLDESNGRLIVAYIDSINDTRILIFQCGS